MFTTAASALEIENTVFMSSMSNAEETVRGAHEAISRRRGFALVGGYVARQIHLRHLHSQEAFLQSLGYAIVSEPEPINI